MEHLKNDCKVRKKVILLAVFRIENGVDPKLIQKYKNEKIGNLLSEIRSERVRLSFEERKILEKSGLRLEANKRNTQMRKKLLLEFYTEKGREPKQREEYQGEKIGSFLNSIRNGLVKLSDEEKNAYEDLGLRLTFESRHERVKRKLELLWEFYNEKGREPKQLEEYKGEKIGNFLRSIRSGKVKLSEEQMNKSKELGIRLTFNKRK